MFNYYLQENGYRKDSSSGKIFNYKGEEVSCLDITNTMIKEVTEIIYFDFMWLQIDDNTVDNELKNVANEYDINVAELEIPEFLETVPQEMNFKELMKNILDEYGVKEGTAGIWEEIVPEGEEGECWLLLDIYQVMQDIIDADLGNVEDAYEKMFLYWLGERDLIIDTDTGDILDNQGNIWGIGNLKQLFKNEMSDNYGFDSEDMENAIDNMDVLDFTIVFYENSKLPMSEQPTVEDITIEEYIEQQIQQQMEDRIPKEDDNAALVALRWGEDIQNEANTYYCNDKDIAIPFKDITEADWIKGVPFSNETYGVNGDMWKDGVGQESYGSYDSEGEPIIVYSKATNSKQTYGGNNVLDYWAFFKDEINDKEKLQNYIWSDYAYIENGSDIGSGTFYDKRAYAYNVACLTPTIPPKINQAEAKITYDFEENCYYIGPMSVNYTFYGIRYDGKAELFKSISDISAQIDGVEYNVEDGKINIVFEGEQRTEYLAPEFDAVGYKYPVPNEKFYIQLPRENFEEPKKFEGVNIKIKEVNYDAEHERCDVRKMSKTNIWI